jgi:DNA-binding response OmpR family regulator
MAQKKILAVDDDPEVLELLSTSLQTAGYAVITALNGTTALEKLHAEAPDLVILDLMLPDIGGMEICRQIRANPLSSAIPVLMLTARKMIDDKISGLEQGADAYLIKPFEPKELVAQIKSAFRRLELSGRIIKKGPIEINPQFYRITVHGQEMTNLSAREFNLLYALMEAAPHPLNREELYKKIWIEGAYPDTTRRIDMMIQRVRQKLGADAAQYIKTVEGTGYCFDAA